MSYDLVFWKQASSSAEPPSRIYEFLIDGAAPNFLAEISVDKLLDRVRQMFPGIIEKGGLTFWEGGDRGMFEVYCSSRHFHFCCRGLGASDMNKLIDIANEFECRLYDPQTDTRYTA